MRLKKVNQNISKLFCALFMLGMNVYGVESTSNKDKSLYKNPDVMEAAEKGDVEILKALEKSEHMPLILNKAAKQGKINIVKHITKSENKPTSDVVGQSLVCAVSPNIEIRFDKYSRLIKPTQEEISLSKESMPAKLNVIKYLTSTDCPIEPQSNDVGHALIVAAGKGELDIVKHLASTACKTPPRAQDWGLALREAAGTGKTGIVTYLTNKEYNLLISPKDLGHALREAAEKGEFDIVKHLTSQACKVPPSPDAVGLALSEAAKQGKIKIVQYLASEQPDFKPKVEAGGWALIEAVQQGQSAHFDIIQYLTSDNACNVNPVQGRMSWAVNRALQIALKEGKNDIVKYLFQCWYIQSTKEDIKEVGIGKKDMNSKED